MAEPRTAFRVGPKDLGKRLDRFLLERIPGLSRTRIQRAIRTRVSLSWGVRARPSTPVQPGGEVHLRYTPPVEEVRDLPIPVLRREQGWLAVDKPAGLPVHPVNRVRENTLIRMLRRQEDDPGLRLAHRLDRETSGVLLVARDPYASRALATAFERGEIHKEYLAWVRGVVEEDTGVITLPIRRDEGSRVLVRLETGAGGRPSETGWRVERRLPDRTLLRVLPRTGRRHQIRVHLASMGHPILGDLLYGRPDRDYLDWMEGVRDPRSGGGPRRHLLHCARLRFPDPAGGGECTVDAPLPPDFHDEPLPPPGAADGNPVR
jgi:23S rRNA pseudouridine1911/1915/1917 synthase